MATSLQRYAVEDVLPEVDREVLVDWLVRSITGDELIRPGVPEGWRVGDKTGVWQDAATSPKPPGGPAAT